MARDVMSPVAAGQAKQALRVRMRRRLRAIEPAAAEEASERVAAAVLALAEVADGGILCCLSFGLELDSRRLVRRLLAEGREVFLPRVARHDTRLHVHPFPCRLETLRFGLEQPVADAPELAPEEIDARIDVALILGLAFDRRGYRLGYGGGYFDRFLAARRPLPIGLAYACQLVDALPVAAHDVPMRAVVTEDGVVRPAASVALGRDVPPGPS